MYCGDKSQRPKYEPVLFEIKIDTNIQNTVRFANIKDESYISAEEEILFSAGAVFRIIDIILINDKDQRYYVKLELSKEEDLRDLYEYYSKLINAEDNKSPLMFGLILNSSGDHNRAEHFYRNMQDSLKSGTHEDQSNLHHNMSVVFTRKGQYKEALEHAQCGLAESQYVPDDIAPMANNLCQIANSFMFLGDNSTAEIYFKRSLLLYLNAIHNQNKLYSINIAHVCCSLSLLYKNTNRLADAWKTIRKAIEMYSFQVPYQHPFTATALNNLAGVFKDARNFEQALLYYQQAYEIQSKCLPDSPDCATFLNNIGLTYLYANQLDNVLEYLMKGYELRRRILSEDHPDIFSSYHNIAIICAKQGRYDDALEWRRKFAKMSEHRLPFSHINRFNNHVHMVQLEFQLNQYSQCIKTAMTAIAMTQNSAVLQQDVNTINYLYFPLVQSYLFLTGVAHQT
ncbi:unnamed protein product [Rotaria sordida]|uniref:Kinesin light chain n=1 Tax=Rotaria sordida TaxID=392033 RepID=A0A815KFG1_9BILA|nr:unnamed protein product [Rotaria sordida]CAF1463752.1 unnamed protein product [Rotaria sordida]CAF1522710.1 unnamed protein product [Rotaria sordida]CAF1621981.1 unnamed protein product [Rotaria sordida]CAF4148676.1 unnamed protein product [Rotaria sordida]